MRNNHIGAYIKSIGLVCEWNFNRDLKEFNLTSVQLSIVRYLVEHKDEIIHQKDIENEFGLKNSTVSGILKRLEAKEYLKRETGIDDSRYKLITIKEKGLALNQELKRRTDAFEAKLLKNFSDDEKNHLIDYLIRIYNNARWDDKND